MTTPAFNLVPLLAQDSPSLSSGGLILALVPLVQWVGVGAIVWGVYSTVVRQIATETALARGLPRPETDGERPSFNHYLALGIEFLAAASAIRTIVDPELQQVAVLGGLVAIRAFIGLYPRWDKARLLPAQSAQPPKLASPASALSAATETVMAHAPAEPVTTNVTF